MRALLYFAAWELINIALEYTATAWVKLPRWFLAVVAVNLATHPAFTLVLARFWHSLQAVLPCEAVIVCVEALLLMAIYGFRHECGELFDRGAYRAVKLKAGNVWNRCVLLMTRTRLILRKIDCPVVMPRGWKGVWHEIAFRENDRGQGSMRLLMGR